MEEEASGRHFIRLGEAFQALFEAMNAAGKAFTRVAEEGGELLQGLAAAGRVTHHLEQAGWLAHHTTPFAEVLEIAAQDNPDSSLQIDAALETYYAEQWSRISREIASRINSLDIDDEAKAAFGEALSAHEHGLYRASCRVLFPEIERVLCVEIHDGDWTKSSAKRHREFMEVMQEKVPAGVVLTQFADIWSWQVFQKLAKHVYVRVIPTNASEFRDIPNRHATLHGIIPYSRLKHSINTIIIADYVFSLVSSLKSYASSVRRDT